MFSLSHQTKLSTLLNHGCRLAAVLGMFALNPVLAHAEANAKPLVVERQSTEINVNTAAAETLAELSGVGLAKAKAIIDYREKFGRFRTVEDLLAVEGIGKATLAKNRNRIRM